MHLHVEGQCKTQDAEEDWLFASNSESSLLLSHKNLAARMKQ